MKRILSSILLFATIAIAAIAAENNIEPVRWRCISKKSAEGNYYTLTIRGIVTSGWHLYGLSLPDGGPKATSIKIIPESGVDLVGSLKANKEPVEVYDPLFDMKLNWWDSTVEFKQQFKLTTSQQTAIHVEINYMACDGTTCRPPKTEKFDIPLNK